ncbi:MAG: ABC transporter permease [Thermomicrobiales bacterium]
MDRLSALRFELQLYGRLVGARVRGQVRYRVSFLIQIASNFALMFTELVVIYILFRHFESLGGWSGGEVAFLYAFSAIPFSISHIVGSGFAGFQNQMVRGEFDRVLVRPASAFGQVLSSDLQLRHIGRLTQGGVALVIALALVDVEWTAGRIFYAPVAVLSAVVLFMSLFTIEATLCFWTTEGTEAINAFTYGGTTLAQYPMHIYDQWLRRLFLWIIPLGFVVFEPALYLLDKPDPLGLPSVARFLAPLAALCFAVAAGLLWRIGIRRYRSTGS